MGWEGIVHGGESNLISKGQVALFGSGSFFRGGVGDGEATGAGAGHL